MVDITTLAAWGEFIGGIAVVVSLIYLASQIRQNSKLLRASAASATSQLTLSASDFLRDPDLSRIWWDGCDDRESLSDADRRIFDPLIGTQLQAFQHYFRFFHEGIISLDTWEDYKRPNVSFVSRPGVQQWWGEWGHNTFGGDFRDFIERLIREGEAAG